MFASQTKEKEIAISPEKLQLDEEARRILKAKAMNLKVRVTDTCNDKPVVVLIHGIGACKEVFKFLIDSLSTDFHVIAIDLPGHGESLNIGREENLSLEEKAILSRQLYNLPALILLITLVLKALNIKDSYSILGWSIGGHIAFGLANKYPELINCLITNGTPPINYSFQNLREGFSSWFVDTIVKDWLENPKFYTKDEAEAMSRGMGYTDVEGKDKYFVASLMKADPLFRQYFYRTLTEFKGLPELCAKNFLQTNRTIPVCFIEGWGDLGINIRFIQQCFDTYLARMQNSRFTAYDAGHSVFRAYPEEFKAEVLSFLKASLNCKPVLEQGGP